MSTQQLVKLVTTVDGKEQTYTGRFLGFIKDDEFNALVQKPDKVATRLESKATQSLMDVATKFDTMIGHRLVMTIKKIGDAEHVSKSLFITEGLTIIDSVTPRVDRKWDTVTAKYTEAAMGKVTFQVGGDGENIEVQETE
jgi:hypothetical protein